MTTTTSTREDLHEPQADARARRTPDPATVERAKAKGIREAMPAILESIGIPRRFLGARLSDFQNKTLINDILRDLKAGRGVHLFGPFGTGKSHLAAALLRELVRPRLHVTGWSGADPRYRYSTSIDGSLARYAATPGARLHLEVDGPGFLFLSVPGLLRQLRLGFAQDRDPGDLIGQAINAEVLVLDDLGRNRLTGFAEDSVYEVINGRYEADRLTVCTSNYALEELPGRIGPAAADRVVDLCSPVHLGGESRRQPPTEGS